MTETTARIRWETGQWDNLVGYVGTIKPWAFQIWHIDDRWNLITSFPEHQPGIGVADDPDALKDRAERWLAGFVASLGAVFADKACAHEPEGREIALDPAGED